MAIQQTAAQLIAELEDEGYHLRAPSFAAAEIDWAVAAHATCEACGHTGLNYKPYRLPPPQWSYRAVAACPECGAGFEF